MLIHVELSEEGVLHNWISTSVKEDKNKVTNHVKCTSELLGTLLE